MRIRHSIAACLAAGAVLASVACQREERRAREVPPSTAPTKVVVESDLHPGKGSPSAGTSSVYEETAYSLSEGQRLFNWYNCSGCHANGGGGIGPPLIDNKWIYGSDPANIHETIVEGRPNGMPSFHGKIPEYQVWQLVAYVRSMSGLVRSDVAPSRQDHMSAKTPESEMPKQPPKKTKTPG